MLPKSCCDRIRHRVAVADEFSVFAGRRRHRSSPDLRLNVVWFQRWHAISVAMLFRFSSFGRSLYWGVVILVAQRGGFIAAGVPACCCLPGMVNILALTPAAPERLKDTQRVSAVGSHSRFHLPRAFSQEC